MNGFKGMFDRMMLCEKNDVEWTGKRLQRRRVKDHGDEMMGKGRRI